MTPTPPKLVLLHRVAELYAVKLRTVYDWVRHNRVHTVRTPTGRLRITEEEYERLKRELRKEL